jgi:hypothetical protein
VSLHFFCLLQRVVMDMLEVRVTVLFLPSAAFCDVVTDMLEVRVTVLLLPSAACCDGYVVSKCVE